jgi:hypothetical protein
MSGQETPMAVLRRQGEKVEQIMTRLKDEALSIPLKQARLCCNCDVIHAGRRCPTCGSDQSSVGLRGLQ